METNIYTPESTKSTKIWHSGSPPFIWWFQTTVMGFPCWRWWDGYAWSRGYSEKELPKELEPSIHSVEEIQWCDYWPENARVARIWPDGRVQHSGVIMHNQELTQAAKVVSALNRAIKRTKSSNFLTCLVIMEDDNGNVIIERDGKNVSRILGAIEIVKASFIQDLLKLRNGARNE